MIKIKYKGKKFNIVQSKLDLQGLEGVRQQKMVLL